MPLALIEYGMNALPAIATQVGQCAEVLDDGKAGILVPPATPNALAEAIIGLLEISDAARGTRSAISAEGLQAATARRRVYNKSLRCTKAFFNESGDPIDWQFSLRTRTARAGCVKSWRCV